MKDRIVSAYMEFNDLSKEDQRKLISELTDEILDEPESLISVTKLYKGRGTWISDGFVNEYYFGSAFSILLERALSGKITHDEDREFEVRDFTNEIYAAVEEYMLFD